MKVGPRPKTSNAPVVKTGRFSRLQQNARRLISPRSLGWLAVAYLFLYLLLVIGSYGALTTLAPVTLPQGAGFTVSRAPLGLALQVPTAQVDVGYGTTDGQALTLQQTRIVWPLLTPWHVVASADNGRFKWPGTQESDLFEGRSLELSFALPYRIQLGAGSIDWRIVPHSVKAEGVPDADPTTFVGPRFSYRKDILRQLTGVSLVGGAAETLDVMTSPILLPTTALGGVLQVEQLKFRLSSSRILPASAARDDVAAWRAADGRLSVEDFSLAVIGIDLLMAGDVSLGDKLAPEGNMQLQVSGISDGYARLGQLNIIPPQQYRMLGYLLQAAPDMGAKTFTIPVKIEKNKVFVGPAAAFGFGLLPWQLTETLLDTPVAKPPVDVVPVVPQPVPQMTPAPVP